VLNHGLGLNVSALGIGNWVSATTTQFRTQRRRRANYERATYAAIMSEGASLARCGRRFHSSSVTNGISGCMSFNDLRACQRLKHVGDLKKLK
jgi:hypothetical protein